MRGPVHKTIGLIGRIIKFFDADLLCYLAADCPVLIRGDVSVKRDQQAVSLMIRAMAVCAVDAPGKVTGHPDIVQEGL